MTIIVIMMFTNLMVRKFKNLYRNCDMTHSVPAASVTHLSDAVDGEAPRDAVQ
jgi:hypothetical protein